MTLSFKFMAVLTMIFLYPSLCFGSLCPHNDDVTAKIGELATHESARINDQTYHLIGHDETGIFYSEQLLENGVQLNGFLKVSNLFDRNLPKAEARLISLLPKPNFCAYKISMGENTSQVIALSVAQ